MTDARNWGGSNSSDTRFRVLKFCMVLDLRKIRNFC